ncbi:MAG TPA: serine O-acetyltransferase EpsC [Planctomycetota bacterium]|nr:serine O-acetyltransferase EpsC [Planctomycetota bacterium]
MDLKEKTGRPEDFERHIPEIVDEVLKSYEQHGVLDNLTSRPMPALPQVITILADLQSVLFPQHFNTRKLDRKNISYYIGDKIDMIFAALSEQISRSFQHECPAPGKRHEPCDSCKGRGEGEAIAFLRKVPALREMLANDVQAAYDGDPAARSFDEIIFSYPGLRAIITYRIAHELHVQSVPLLPRIMTEYAHSVTGVDIHPGATIGRSFFIDHGTGVVIGETSQIGNNVKIYQGVTLGALSFPKGDDGKIIRGQKRHPTIEDDVTIYSGATILGPRTVGKGAVIGGNVWLTGAIPPGTKVVIDKPRLVYEITSRDGALDYQI